MRTNPLNTVLRGHCLEVMKTLPSASVDFILTDPPYLVNFRDRAGRTVRNDDDSNWVKPAFHEMFRLLKPNTFCVSFYGWNKVDVFMAAWRAAGFRVGGHIVFRKSYASTSRYLQYRHESAYLLLKGRPAMPEHPVPDVIDWTYTGNRLHPTQKPLGILAPLMEAFSRPGQIVLDPFCGSGSTLAAAKSNARACIGIELDEQHARIATARMEGRLRGVAA